MMINEKLTGKLGFTLIELLVTLSIVSLLVAIGIPLYHTFQENLILNNAAEKLVNDLRTTQRKAINSQNGVEHGVHFDSSSYTLFGGLWSAPYYSVEKDLESDITITQGAGAEINFSRLTGEAADFQIKLALPNGKEKNITITSGGLVYLN